MDYGDEDLTDATAAEADGAADGNGESGEGGEGEAARAATPAAGGSGGSGTGRKRPSDPERDEREGVRERRTRQAQEGPQPGQLQLRVMHERQLAGIRLAHKGACSRCHLKGCPGSQRGKQCSMPAEQVACWRCAPDLARARLTARGDCM